MIMHCLKGGAMSKELIALSKDESLSYIPFVSIALPINAELDFKGHVFCLMLSVQVVIICRIKV
jgi:hypothetical protein